MFRDRPRKSYAWLMIQSINILFYLYYGCIGLMLVSWMDSGSVLTTQRWDVIIDWYCRMISRFLDDKIN